MLNVNQQVVAVAVITPAVCIPMYRHAKALLASWDGEDEDVSSVIDGKLSAALLGIQR